MAPNATVVELRHPLQDMMYAGRAIRTRSGNNEQATMFGSTLS